MAHFAQIDKNGMVKQVLVIDQTTIDTGLFGNPKSFIQTSYNTHGGVHTKGGTPFRKNFASVGYIYDKTRDAFIPPKPYDSWILNEATCLWEAPVPKPDDDKLYAWDEETKSWIQQIVENK